eukprot:9489311-Pyramimonas_sp.AAC.1
MITCLTSACDNPLLWATRCATAAYVRNVPDSLPPPVPKSSVVAAASTRGSMLDSDAHPRSSSAPSPEPLAAAAAVGVGAKASGVRGAAPGVIGAKASGVRGASPSPGVIGMTG